MNGVAVNGHSELLDRLQGTLIIGSQLVQSSNIRTASGPAPQSQRSWASATVAQAAESLTQATAAQPVWAATELDDRIKIVQDYHDAMLRNTDQIASLMVLETGKTISDARAEVASAAAVTRELIVSAQSGLFAEEVMQDGGVRLRVRPVPIGPALLITPWNFPLSMASRKVVTALLAGCTALLKPSEVTPLTGLAVGAMLIDCGIPPGVLSVLPSADSAAFVATLAGNPKLRKISFTGSTAVGRKVLRASTEHFQRVSLELGGNAPCIILPEADLAAAAGTIWASKMFNNGQVCTAPNRVLVPESMMTEAEERFCEMVTTSRVENPWLPEAVLGPVISATSRRRLEQLVAQVSNRRVVRGAVTGELENEVAATVIVDASPDDRVSSEELFGPVLPLISYPDGDLDTCLRIANGTEYGLASYVFGADEDLVDSVVSRLDFGMTAVNRGTVSHPKAPFGGVKHSGFGRENSRVGLAEYLDLHSIHEWAL